MQQFFVHKTLTEPHKEGNILPSSGDSIWMDGYLSDKAKELLDKVMSKEIWDACRVDETALDTLCEEETLIRSLISGTRTRSPTERFRER